MPEQEAQSKDSAAGSREEIGCGVAPSFLAAIAASTAPRGSPARSVPASPDDQSL
jgi:hypothetical protein